jgi:two-component system sensor histidine kinase YesM
MSPPSGFQYQELYELNESFSAMRFKLKASMDELLETRKQELKSRNLALQSQINPHFYYNSLASVIALAENDQPDEVIRMCRNLTKIMRYITNTQNIVTIQEEIDYINQYLDCMKVRYQTSLNYIIDIDPELSREPIPRLIIQPLVENAIKYGIDSEPPWGIAIHGYLKDDGWRIEVMDSGNGFSEESIERIWTRIKDAEAVLGLPEMQINGMGTLNVYLRWHLYAGDTMIFEFGNTDAGHAIVTIGRTIMVNEEGEDSQYVI